MNETDRHLPQSGRSLSPMEMAIEANEAKNLFHMSPLIGNLLHSILSICGSVELSRLSYSCRLSQSPSSLSTVGVPCVVLLLCMESL